MLALQTSGMARGQQSEQQAAALVQLREENEQLAAELEHLRAECVRLSGEVQTLEASLQVERQNVDGDAKKEEELERLRAENSDLAARSSQSVLMTVELTTLRNKVCHPVPQRSCALEASLLTLFLCATECLA